MAYEVTRAEYVTIDGVPLATPAWEINDLSELWDVADVLGETQPVPYRRGVVPFRRAYGGKSVSFPLTVFGAEDPDGVAYLNARAGLAANRDLLVRDVLRPLQVESGDGTRTLVYHHPDGSTRSGPVLPAGGLRPTPIGPTAFAATLALVLVEGGLRSTVDVDETSASVPAATTGTLTVPNPGTDYQDAAVLTLTGTATAVRITNTTADPDGGVWLEFGGALTGGVTIDTATFSAVRSAISVVGLVTFSGFERWLPLVPGDNVLEIEPTGGTATLNVTHRPFYA